MRKLMARVNVLNTARWGLTSMEHWYGLPEALFDGQRVQNYPADYNHQNEQQRFWASWALMDASGEARFRQKWNAVMDELLKQFHHRSHLHHLPSNPRCDVARRADWHDEYTLPSLARPSSRRIVIPTVPSFRLGKPRKKSPKENYRLWMRFVNEYKIAVVVVTVGSDSGYIYKVYGFGTIEELELLREAVSSA